MHVRLITVPYDSAVPDRRMGLGPAHLVSLGVERVLRAHGHRLEIERVDADERFDAPVASAFALNRNLSLRVAAATAAGSFPLVLSGNCNAALGIVAAFPQVGVAWFDAHADFNTPDTTESGFFDGMSLAVLTGMCWRTLAATIPGFRPLPSASVMLIGARSIDSGEADLLRGAEVPVVTASTIHRLSILDALAPALRSLHARSTRIYLHIDLDVLDPSEARANAFAAPNGLTLKQLLAAIRRIGEQFDVCAAALTAYDPDQDSEGKAGQAALAVIEGLVAAAAR